MLLQLTVHYVSNLLYFLIKVIDKLGQNVIYEEILAKNMKNFRK